jgi:hypothetical protein
VRAAQRQVVTEIQSHPGKVLALDDPYYLRLAGKPMHADGGTLFWLSQMGLVLPSDLADKISAHEYAAILLSNPVENGMHARTESARRLNRLINEHYSFSRRIMPEDRAVATLRLPRYLYLPRPDPSLASFRSRSVASGFPGSSASTRSYQAPASADRPR